MSPDSLNTRIIKIDPSVDSKQLRSLLEPCSEIIRGGGLVVFPTETVYGLGANGLDPNAARRIYSAKGRPSDNPLIIHVANPEDAEQYAYTTDVYYKLASAFMPGPFTVIMRAKDCVPRETRGGLDTVAIRCPSSVIAHELISLSGVPIAAPSANISGSPSPTSFSHARDDMYGRVEAIIDGGECDIGLESTIVSIVDNEVTLLRPGRITPDNIRVLGIELKVADAVINQLKDGEVALSPGMKYRHYAPRAELILLDGAMDRCVKYIKSIESKNVAVICYHEDREYYTAELPFADVYDFGQREDLDSQAHALFYILREADKRDYDVIFAPLPSVDGVGLALYNRMIRAAAHKIIRM